MRCLRFYSLLVAAFPTGLALNISKILDQSIRSQISTSPLHIQLQNSAVFGSVQAVITNRGPTTAYFSTWRNPLSIDSRARKVNVITAADELVSFLPSEGFAITENDTISTDYQRLPAGASVTREIDIASNYDLQPEEAYFVQAGGLVPYYLEGEDPTITQNAAFETNILPFTAPEALSLKIPQGILAPASNSYILMGCSNEAIMTKLNKTIPIAAAMAKKAADHATSGKNRAAFTAYFRKDSAENRKKVSGRLTAIHKALTSKTGPIRIGCKAKCTGYYAIGAAWTETTTGKTEFCPTMATKTYADDVKRCNRANFPGVIVHELTHSSVLFRPSTGDRAGSPKACKALLEAQALLNADNYNLYAQSVYLNTVC